MKKIYLSIASIALCLTAVSQSAFMLNNNKAAYTGSRTGTKQKISSANGAIKGRFDVSFSLISANGIQNSDIGSSGKVGIFVDPVFCDSTVKSSFSNSTAYINTIKFGTTFDPKSIIYDFLNAESLLSSGDAYTLDTVWVAGVYQRKTAFTDTLMLEVVWADTANTNVFGRWAYAAPYNYTGIWATPKYVTTTASQGQKAFLGAPTTNKIVIKKLLTDADTAFFRINDYYPFVLNGAIGQAIPANNIVSANVSYIPGQPTYSVGTVSYNPGTGPSPATMNGFAAVEFAQLIPSDPAAGSDYFDDYLKGKNYSQALYPRQRYGVDAGAFATVLRGAIGAGYWIDFSIRGNSTVGVKEESSKGFALGQNAPNPFSNGSTVKYELVKNANSAIFTVTDVMGRVISTQTVETTKGIHAVNLGSYSSGVYYYSLNVDGNVSTKKMIAQ